MIENNIRCNECGICETICPTSSISLIEKNGVLIPNIDAKNCINCSLCVRKCPVINKTDFSKRTIYNKCFTFISNDENSRNSSSGGFSFAINSLAIENNGVVYGVTYNKNMQPIYERIIDQSQLNKVQKSKYVKAKPSLVFKQVKNDLHEGKNVFFTGLPCEIFALKFYLSKEYSNLFTISLMCGGAVPQYLFNKYLEEISYKDISSIDFRTRTKNNILLYRTSVTISGKEKILSKNDDFYIPILGSDFVRRSCHSCDFGIHNSYSDFFIGDFYDAKSNKRASLVFCCKEQMEILYNLKNCELEEIEVSTGIKKANYRSKNKAKDLSKIEYENFYKTVDNFSLKKAVKIFYI